MKKQDNAMRKCLIVHPGAELYGSDRVVLESAIGLLEEGASVVVCIPAKGPLHQLLRAEGATTVRGPSLVLRKMLLRPRNWPSLVRDAAVGLVAGIRVVYQYRPDVILVNTITLPMWPLLARVLGIPVVTHIHEAEASASRRVRKAIYAPHLLSHKVVLNSDFSTRVLADCFPALAARSSVVYNGVPGPAERTAPRPDLNGELRVLFLGRLSERKGPHVAVRAIHELKQRGIRAHLTIAGAAFEGKEQFADELRNLVSTLGIQGDVSFTGFTPDIWPLLDDADALVVPSTVDEPFGNTAVEGILAGRPVVVSNTSGLREAARGYESAIYVEPNDDQGIADALERVYREWEYFSTHAATDAIAAEEKHSLATYRKKIADIVLNAADQP
ncbi:glycosyltransferase family 4 protein [Arthrobacter rhombi]|uniref:glycosyltransferase n=1 Tax=Arthrobacter rhombi TaxID=71253 RepID=UPI0031DA6995